MTAQTRERLDLAIAEAGEAKRNNSRKWDPVYEVFADDLGAKNVVGKFLTDERQLGNRKDEMSGGTPLYVILSILVGGPKTVRLDRVKAMLAAARIPTARCALIVEYDQQTGLVAPLELQVYQDDPVVQKIATLYEGELTPIQVLRKELPLESDVSNPKVTKPMVAVPMVIDDRIRRAIRLSVSTTSAVLLVGPPGTGKTRLLSDLIADVQADPAAFGFSGPVADPITVTPDESWSARELVGGMTIAEDGALRFREGHVLRAISEDRWLVLDEANRADLDKVFGALLTWLSDQEVDLGPVSTDAVAPSVRLGWSNDASSKIETAPVGADGDGATGGEVPVRYMAGGDWRLLGTYNALDAQRVFRFGLALGRRFLRVPVPPLEPDDFALAAQGLLEGLPRAASKGIVGLYTAHFSSEETQLGPALFMRIPDYVRAGLDATGVDTEDDLDQDARVLQLVAEAYLVNVGVFLARYDQQILEDLGSRISADAGVPAAEWTWVLELSRHLG